MEVRDAMQRHVTTIREMDSVGLARQLMLWARIRHLPVVRDDGTVAGVLSERDLLRYYAAQAATPENLAKPVRQCMSVPVRWIGPEAPLSDAAAELITQQLGCLPVIDRGQLVGILTVEDALAPLAQCPVEAPQAGGAAATPVASIMYPEPVAAHAEDFVTEVNARMARASVRHACVIDGEGRVIGIVSDRDIRRAAGDPVRGLLLGRLKARGGNLRVNQVMSARPQVVNQSESVDKALRLLLGFRVGALPVVDDDGRLRGIVSHVDVLAYFAKAEAA